MRIVVALGGNALLRRGEPAEASLQKERVDEAAALLAPLVSDHELVVTHGNGPQIGLLALTGESYAAVKPYPLDVLGAESQGMIGYLLQNSLSNALPHSTIAALLTRVEVDVDDPAFEAPTKPVGPVYDEIEARAVAATKGWRLARDGTVWRRVVASPEPQRILELSAIETLLASGAVVICAGGGGIPTIAHGLGHIGVEAVIDKDLTAALLAEKLGADMLMILTDVPGVALDWGSEQQRFLSRLYADQVTGLDLPDGSMKPKVDACIRFVEATRGRAAIGSIHDIGSIIEGTAGTEIVDRSAHPVFVEPKGGWDGQDLGRQPRLRIAR
jgi:carbamate kinase